MVRKNTLFPLQTPSLAFWHSSSKLCYSWSCYWKGITYLCASAYQNYLRSHSVSTLAQTCCLFSTHTHTHTHADTHARIHASTHTHACTQTHTHTHSNTHMRAHTHTKSTNLIHRVFFYSKQYKNWKKLLRAGSFHDSCQASYHRGRNIRDRTGRHREGK